MTSNERRVTLCGGPCWVSTLLAIAIAEVVVAQRFGGDADCQSTTFRDLSFKLWLTIKGAAALVHIGTTVCANNNNSISSSCWRALVILEWLFRIIWLVFGAIMFRSNCPSLGPHPLHVMMWCSLVFGFVFAICPSHLVVFVSRSSHSSIPSTPPAVHPPSSATSPV